MILCSVLSAKGQVENQKLNQTAAVEFLVFTSIHYKKTRQLVKDLSLLKFFFFVMDFDPIRNTENIEIFTMKAIWDSATKYLPT